MKTCCHCSKPFTAKRADAKYCCSACNKAATRPKRKPKAPLTKLLNNPFGKTIFYSCRKAGTVEILTPNCTLEGLEEIRQLCITRTLGNVAVTNQFDLSHLFPAVAKDGRLGLFIPENFIIGLASSNRSLKNRITTRARQVATRCSIKQTDLAPRWKVAPEMTTKQVLQLADDYTKGLLSEFVTTYNIQSRKAASPDDEQATLPAHLAKDAKEVFRVSLAHFSQYWLSLLPIGVPVTSFTALLTGDLSDTDDRPLDDEPADPWWDEEKRDFVALGWPRMWFPETSHNDDWLDWDYADLSDYM